MARKLSIIVIVFLVCASLAHAQDTHRFGAGIHYWRTVDSIDVANIEESGKVYVFSYQYCPSMLAKLELDVEVFPNEIPGINETVYAPQVLGILGGGIYAGLGIGSFYADGEFSDKPFYILRAGLDWEILPNIHADLNVNYHFTDFNDIKTVKEDVDTDTITIGAAIRLAMF
jgi:hypothetical protein